MAGEGFSEEVAFGMRPECGAGHKKGRGRVFLAERTTCTKALRQNGLGLFDRRKTRDIGSR